MILNTNFNWRANRARCSATIHLSLLKLGIARLMIIDPEAPTALLQGSNSQQHGRGAVKTGIKHSDRPGLMEVVWYTLQLKRLAAGRNPRPDESSRWTVLKEAGDQWLGTYKTRR